jgi:hypothetical protein
MVPEGITLPGSVKQISARFNLSVVLLESGEIWGFGAIGNSRTVSPVRLVQTQELGSPVSRIEATDGFDGVAFVILTALGELHTFRAGVVTPITTTPGRLMSISCGFGWLAALTNNGTLWTAAASEQVCKAPRPGREDDGRLGRPRDPLRRGVEEMWGFKQVRLPGGLKVAEVACGAAHALVRASDGRVFAFGRAEKGCLGVDGEAERRRKAKSPALACEVLEVTKLSAGGATRVFAGPNSSFCLSSLTSFHEDLFHGYERAHFSDFELMPEGGRPCRAHRVLLAAVAEPDGVLARALASEITAGVPVPAPSSHVDALLTTLYSGRPPPNLPKAWVRGMGAAATHLGISRDVFHVREDHPDGGGGGDGGGDYFVHISSVALRDALGKVVAEGLHSDLAVTYSSRAPAVRAHRFLIASRSEFFLQMLSSGFMEGSAQSVSVAGFFEGGAEDAGAEGEPDDPEMAGEAVRLMMRFICTDGLGRPVSMDELVGLFALSDAWLLPGFHRHPEVVKAVQDGLNAETAVTAYLLSKAYRTAHLEQIATGFMVDHLEEMEAHPSFAEELDQETRAAVRTKAAALRDARAEAERARERRARLEAEEAAEGEEVQGSGIADLDQDHARLTNQTKGTRRKLREIANGCTMS